MVGERIEEDYGRGADDGRERQPQVEPPRRPVVGRWTMAMGAARWRIVKARAWGLANGVLAVIIRLFHGEWADARRERWRWDR